MEARQQGAQANGGAAMSGNETRPSPSVGVGELREGDLEWLGALRSSNDHWPLWQRERNERIDRILAALSSIPVGGLEVAAADAVAGVAGPISGYELTADFVRALPGGKMDDSAFEAIETALDRADASCRDEDGRWLTLPERVADLGTKLKTAKEALMPFAHARDHSGSRLVVADFDRAKHAVANVEREPLRVKASQPGKPEEREGGSSAAERTKTPSTPPSKAG
jgi:hypothetical protein